MNQLKVNQQESIIALHERGWSKRKIARELGVDRVTVRKYLAAAKSPGVQTGSGGGGVSNSPTPRTGSSASLCESWREPIERALGMGLSIQRIHQDLVREHQFCGWGQWLGSWMGSDR